jgi:FkbM family methyltransferase
MNLKALARYCYANVPGVATVRFAAKDLTSSYLFKQEFLGVRKHGIETGLIVDIGANRGQSTAAFRKVAPGCRVVAFEPEPRSAGILSARFRRDDHVAVHECALGSRSGFITFYLPRYGRWDCDGMAATDFGDATEWLKNPGRMYRFDPARLTVREHVVACETLDSRLLDPVLIKLHAQGAELQILEGARETLTRLTPALMCAFPSPTVTEFLAGYGYRPFIFDRGRFEPGIAPPHVTFTWYLVESRRTQVAGPARTKERAGQAQR